MIVVAVVIVIADDDDRDGFCKLFYLSKQVKISSALSVKLSRLFSLPSSGDEEEQEVVQDPRVKSWIGCSLEAKWLSSGEDEEPLLLTAKLDDVLLLR